MTRKTLISQAAGILRIHWYSSSFGSRNLSMLCQHANWKYEINNENEKNGVWVGRSRSCSLTTNLVFCGFETGLAGNVGVGKA